MSGADIPYQLRPNKHVERQLFWELLEYVNKWKSVKEMAYISMGGRFLEDFKQVHTKFGIHDLISIEENLTTHRRQRFNTPIGPLQCKRMKSGDLVTNFDVITTELKAQNYVIWLDYAAAKGRAGQLGEFESLISKLAAGDILKITLNSNLDTFCTKNQSEDMAAYQNRAFDKIKSKLNRYYPANKNFSSSEVTRDGVAAIVSSAVGVAAMKGLSGSRNLTAMPLSSFTYNDGYHDMTTVACIVLETADISDFINRTELGSWEFYTETWGIPTKIGIPDLSMKERLEIDGKLFKTPDDELHAGLGFELAESAELSFEAFKQYVKHYRRYPAFLRMAL